MGKKLFDKIKIQNYAKEINKVENIEKAAKMSSSFANKESRQRYIQYLDELEKKKQEKQYEFKKNPYEIPDSLQKKFGEHGVNNNKNITDNNTESTEEKTFVSYQEFKDIRAIIESYNTTLVSREDFKLSSTKGKQAGVISVNVNSDPLIARNQRILLNKQVVYEVFNGEVNKAMKLAEHLNKGVDYLPNEKTFSIFHFKIKAGYSGFLPEYIYRVGSNLGHYILVFRDFHGKIFVRVLTTTEYENLTNHLTEYPINGFGGPQLIRTEIYTDSILRYGKVRSSEKGDFYVEYHKALIEAVIADSNVEDAINVDAEFKVPDFISVILDNM